MSKQASGYCSSPVRIKPSSSASSGKEVPRSCASSPSTGAEGANRQLALSRAQSVQAFLVEKCGFDPAKIQAFGFGPTRTLCPNDTEEGRRCNRRVEVVFKMPDLPSTQESPPPPRQHLEARSERR